MIGSRDGMTIIYFPAFAVSLLLYILGGDGSSSASSSSAILSSSMVLIDEFPILITKSDIFLFVLFPIL